MRKTTVVQLGQVKDLLAELERMRAGIIGGRINGFYAAVLDENAAQTVYLGGTCKEDTQTATRAILRLSAARAIAEDQAPLIAPSQKLRKV